MRASTPLPELPSHLRPFVVTQDYHRYSAEDHEVWCCAMKQLTESLKDTAHPMYLEGLKRTGIALDHIPSIDEMNVCLQEFGWSAVAVDGFIPPSIFMEFQALKILPIAQSMRSKAQIHYTPAPDILHESAGHAPFIVDIDYAEFLQRFGEVGMKAIANSHDMALYEAVRRLSILKESSHSSAADIDAAVAGLQQLGDAEILPSEAALLSRLHWWTVEYGLVGDVEDYKIFGAGLLSSIAESQRCLDNEAVKKTPLTVNAVLTPYDISNQQPQLFVTHSCKHLSQVLEEFAAAMCYRKGGAESLATAIEAQTICSAVYDTGLQVSGQFCEVLCDAVDKAIYLRTTGPTQLAYQDQQLTGHGGDYHSGGFGSPIGLLQGFSRCLSEYSMDELKAQGLEVGKGCTLQYLSGITVTGRLENVYRQAHRNLLLSFSECRVTDLSGRVLFSSEWGIYDMAVGAEIVSVFGGVADREAMPLYQPAAVAE